MFKLISVIGRASGLLIVGTGIGVGVSKADEFNQGYTLLKVGAVGVATFYAVKAFKRVK